MAVRGGDGRRPPETAAQEAAKFWSRLWLRLPAPGSAAFSVSWPPPAPPPTLPVPARSWKPGAAEKRSAAAVAAAAGAAAGRSARAGRRARGDCPGGGASRRGGAGAGARSARPAGPKTELTGRRALRVPATVPRPWSAQCGARPGARSAAPERDGRCQGRLRRPAFPLGDAEAAPS